MLQKLNGVRRVIGLYVFFVLLLLTGCERRYYTKAHYLEGYLYTPWGEY
jgi:hypothetical protein